MQNTKQRMEAVTWNNLKKALFRSGGTPFKQMLKTTSHNIGNTPLNISTIAPIHWGIQATAFGWTCDVNDCVQGGPLALQQEDLLIFFAICSISWPQIVAEALTNDDIGQGPDWCMKAIVMAWQQVKRCWNVQTAAAAFPALFLMMSPGISQPSWFCYYD